MQCEHRTYDKLFAFTPLLSGGVSCRTEGAIGSSSLSSVSAVASSAAAAASASSLDRFCAILMLMVPGKGSARQRVFGYQSCELRAGR